MVRCPLLVLTLLAVNGCAQLRVASGPPLPVRGPQVVEAESGGGLTTKNIMTVILALKAQLGVCVVAEREASGATGKFVMVWDILPSGEVANLGVRDPEYARLEISQCIARVIGACRFATSEKGDHITFPFKF